jgi:S-adenosylmethionine:tRNA ribosyltransferase-isomerase
MCQTRGRLAAGETIKIEPGRLLIDLIRKTNEGHWIVTPQKPGSAHELLQTHGRIPLPPYIRKGLARPDDQERYQTVFACRTGAIAAPTAGLHFTEALFRALGLRSIDRTFITLHVGQGTFQPIQTSDYRDHQMHREWGQMSEEAAGKIVKRRKEGGRVVAVGTTSVRVLESVAAAGPIQAWSGETDLFIYPPYVFKAVDVLMTNFHLPRSTLLLLVNAFAGADLTTRAYMTAIAERYRFYSYGDAMLIL